MRNKKKKEEFSPNSCSNCFLCHQETGTVQHKSLFQLKCICRYLKINLDKSHSLYEGGNLPPISKFGNEQDLQVTLCDECRLLSDKFSKLYRELEAIQMKLGSCLENLDERMRMFEKGSSIEELIDKNRRGNLERKRKAKNVKEQDRTIDDSDLGSMPMLRREIMLKYRLSFQRSQPRIKIRDVLVDHPRKKRKLNLDIPSNPPALKKYEKKSTNGALPNDPRKNQKCSSTLTSAGGKSSISTSSELTFSTCGRTYQKEMTWDNPVGTSLAQCQSTSATQKPNPPQSKTSYYVPYKPSQSKLFCCKLCSSPFPTAYGLKNHHNAMHYPPVKIIRKLAVDQSSSSGSPGCTNISSVKYQQTENVGQEISQPDPDPVVTVENTQINNPQDNNYDSNKNTIPKPQSPSSSPVIQDSSGLIKVPCFICNVCNRAFRNIGHFSRHVRDSYCGPNCKATPSFRSLGPTSSSPEGHKRPRLLEDGDIPSGSSISVKYEIFDSDTPTISSSSSQKELMQRCQQSELLLDPNSQLILEDINYFGDDDDDRNPFLDAVDAYPDPLA